MSIHHAAWSAVAATALLAACATPTEPEGALRKETVYAVTDAAELVRFNAGQPQRILARQALQGLAAGDRLVGIDLEGTRQRLMLQHILGNQGSRTWCIASGEAGR